MENLIYYFTGTGNSLWASKLLAEELGSAQLISMANMSVPKPAAEIGAIGLIFPVHIWGVPGIVLRVVKALEAYQDKYWYAVAVNGGQVSGTLLQLHGHLRTLGINLSTGFDLVLPSNYIPWGGPGPKDEQLRLFQAAREKIRSAAKMISGREIAPMEKGPWWQRLLFTGIYHLSFKQVPQMDRSFWVDNKCISCSICGKLCPVENISLQQGKPSWLHHCEQCLSCLQWCPQQAIQYGKKTAAYERYHHPDIKASEIIAGINHR